MHACVCDAGGLLQIVVAVGGPTFLLKLNNACMHACMCDAGGSLQIVVAMAVGGAVSAWMWESDMTPGIFTGALLAMSSTSVVVKCLEATK